MKRFLSFVFTFVFILLTLSAFSLTASAAKLPDARTISEAVQKVCPSAFGYVDNTEYYMSSYFSALEDVDDFYIVTCADSTDFSEIGVFHMKSPESLTTNKKILKRYLQKIKQNFENGVVYNAGEYPKFESARVISVGNTLVYAVLDRHNILRAEKAIRTLIPA